MPISVPSRGFGEGNMAGNGVSGGFQSSSGYAGNEAIEGSVENDRPHDPASSGLFGTDFKR